MASAPKIPTASGNASGQDGISPNTAAFGLAAAVTILFNTLLAWVKDAYDPLNTAMAALTGHHWITHSLVDIAVFLLMGWVFRAIGVRIDGMRLSRLLIAACLLGGGGLAAWFLFV